MAHTIKAVREEKGIRQVFIADQLGFDRIYYNRIENNPDYVPRLDVARKLSELLDTPIDQLFPGVKINN